MLKDAEIVVISMPDADARRAFMRAELERLGLSFRFSDGVSHPRKVMGCTLAHIAAQQQATRLPLLVFEDDAACVGDAAALPAPPPSDADILYLGTNTNGCLPNRPEYSGVFGHRSFEGLALARGHDAHYHRLFSMVQAHAILYLTERGREGFMAALTKARRRGQPLDVMFSYAMPDLNVYAVAKPLFIETQTVQPRSKTNEIRAAVTATPLKAVAEGEERIGLKRKWWARVQAVADGKAGLEWRVLEYGSRTPDGELLPPI